jgi:hypothetical protein
MTRYYLDKVEFPKFFSKVCISCQKQENSSTFGMLFTVTAWWRSWDICKNCAQTRARRLSLSTITVTDIYSVADMYECSICQHARKYIIKFKIPALQNMEFARIGDDIYYVDKNTEFQLYCCAEHLKSMLPANAFVDYIKGQERI